VTPYRGRFAPSPTGDLHLGTAATALVAWLAARVAKGTLVMRIEDIDAPRVVDGAEARQLDDLAWLGLDWDEGPDVGGPFGSYRQSERGRRYEKALDQLAARGLTFLCDCSRRDIAAVASAPHDGDEGPRYPGTCRSKPANRSWKRPPAVRLTVPPGIVVVKDRFRGRLEQAVDDVVGDFVLRRGDGMFAYQLAVTVDDLAMGITEVVRGIDLLSSAPRQRMLARLLGGAPEPAFAHVPLLVDGAGGRLAKRLGGHSLRAMREDGWSPAAVIGLLAHLLGLRPTDQPVRPRDLAADVNLERLAALPDQVAVAMAEITRPRS